MMKNSFGNGLDLRFIGSRYQFHLRTMKECHTMNTLKTDKIMCQYMMITWNGLESIVPMGLAFSIKRNMGFQENDLL